MRELIQDWGIAIVISAVVFALWSFLSPSPVSEGSAPALTLPATAGGTVTLSEQQHDAYVINFWATWCAPCRTEIPEFSRFAADHPEVGVYGVSVDDALSTERVGQMAERLGASYTILHDARGDAAQRWGVSGYPTTFVLDRDRRIVSVKMGALDARRLESILAEAR